MFSLISHLLIVQAAWVSEHLSAHHTHTAASAHSPQGWTAEPQLEKTSDTPFLYQGTPALIQSHPS